MVFGIHFLEGTRMQVPPLLFPLSCWPCWWWMDHYWLLVVQELLQYSFNLQSRSEQFALESASSCFSQWEETWYHEAVWSGRLNKGLLLSRTRSCFCTIFRVTQAKPFTLYSQSLEKLSACIFHWKQWKHSNSEKNMPLLISESRERLWGYLGIEHWYKVNICSLWEGPLITVKIQDAAERLVLKRCVSREWQASKCY